MKLIMPLVALTAYSQVPDASRRETRNLRGTARRRYRRLSFDRHAVERLCARPSAHRGIRTEGASPSLHPLADSGGPESSRRRPGRPSDPLRIPSRDCRKHRDPPRENPGSTDGFQVRAFNGATGSLLSTPCLPITRFPRMIGSRPTHRLSLKARVSTTREPEERSYYRDLVDSAAGPTGQVAFYGTALYKSNQAAFNSTVYISTPLTTDRAGNVFFGFRVAGSNPANLVSGIARVAFNGTGTWASAASLTGDSSASLIALNCAPALSNDERTVYIASATQASFATGYLASLNADTLAPIAFVPLLDPRGAAGTISSDSSSTPMVGPDGDVYYGILEGPCCSSHNARGWMLHFDSTLAQTKTPGSFGWDDTASVVSSDAVPSYTGVSSYLILTKYNNYMKSGTGDGVNKVAILDPLDTMQDPYSSTPVSVMKEIITVTGATPNPSAGFPNAVREWCINTVAVDPQTKSAIVNSEDGMIYRWDFTTNTLIENLRLTAGRGEAYTPTVIGTDGTVYAINDAILFAIGN